VKQLKTLSESGKSAEVLTAGSKSKSSVTRFFLAASAGSEAWNSFEIGIKQYDATRLSTAIRLAPIYPQWCDLRGL